MLKTRKLSNGRFAIYKGNVRYIALSYATKREAQERIDVEHKWHGASFTINNRSAAKEA